MPAEGGQMTFLEQCRHLGVCKPGLERVGTRTLEGWYKATDERPQALVWLAYELREDLPAEVRAAVEAALYRAMDRAVREYAPRALESAGLVEEAAKLRALPPVRDAASAKAASRAARAASDASFAASAWAAEAAATEATLAAEAGAAGEAERAAAAASKAAADVAPTERAIQGREIRAALPLEVLRAALEKACSGGQP